MNQEYDFLLVELTETIRKIESIDIRFRNSKQNETLVRSRIEIKNLETRWQNPELEIKEDVE